MSRPEQPDQSESDDSSPDELLGDLESIKELLDEQARTGTAEDPVETSEASVPLLDDMIDGAYKLEESASFLNAAPALGGGRPGRKSRYLSEDLFDALMGDEWKASASDILTEARGAIEAHRNRWTPEDTDELNQALRIRIDETLSAWLQETVQARIHELHAQLLNAAEQTISEKVDALLKARLADGSSEDN